MNKVDTEYFRIVNEILTNGKLKKNRTGIDTIGIFGAQAKYDIDLNAFPVLTTKKIHWPAIVHELLWFISGSTNIKYLVDNNVRIWNEWAYVKYKKVCANATEPDYDIHIEDLEKNCVREMTQDEFVQKIKEDDEFAKIFGELGEGTYGSMWRSFPTFTFSEDPNCNFFSERDGEGIIIDRVDQLQKVIDKLKINPDDRRMIVSAWHPHWVDHCALPPCHCLYHFNTEELTDDERIHIANNMGHKIGWTSVHEMNEQECDRLNIPKRRLNCLLYQRSVDTGLGKPFNIASYSLLTAMIAQCVNMVPGTFTHSMGDTHIYVNHVDGLKLQLTREPKKLPKVWLNPEIKSLFDFKYDDIKLLDYGYHPTIKFDVAV